MSDIVSTITKWIVPFLVIFLLCIILLLSFFNKKIIPRTTPPQLPR